MHTKYDDQDDFAFSDNPTVVRLMRQQRWDRNRARAVRKMQGPGDDDDYDDDDYDDYDYDEEEFDRYADDD